MASAGKRCAKVEAAASDSEPDEKTLVGSQTDADQPKMSASDHSSGAASAISGFVTLPDANIENMEVLLNVVDELRHAGLNSVLSLPQIVVCGDQSAGKSSVLEAVTQIPFPRNAMLCTRFATEIIIRRDSHSWITAKILSDGPQHEKIKNFSKSVTDLTQLPLLIQEATDTIYAAHHGSASNLKAFVSEILSITVSAPAVLPITLVDLPGLIHAETSVQTKQDVEFVTKLVDKYIRNPRTIIFAVISAKSDYANQVILQKARNVDPKGSRTLGVITKPDCLDDGSREEKQWINLAQNRDIEFDLGWHIVRNRTQQEMSCTTEEHQAIEKNFFASRSVYKYVPDGMLGSATLLQRLCRLLFAHLKRELPGLNRDLNEEIAKTMNRLDQLGEQRDSLASIRNALTKAGVQYQRLLSEALTGSYNDAFFSTKIGSMPFNPAKLRAAIRFHNSQYSEQMHRFGGKYKFSGVPVEVLECLGVSDKPSGAEIVPWDCAKKAQQPMSREQAIKWVLEKMQLSRGEELPGCFNATLMKELYWEQTCNWGPITVDYLNRTMVTCVAEFSKGLLSHIMPFDVAERMLKQRVLPSLAKNQKNAALEVNRLLEDKSRAPMTYNHYFTDTVQKLRNEKILARARRVVEINAYTTISQQTRKSAKVVDAEQIMTALTSELVEPDMDRFTAEDTLDCLMALYKDKLKNFVAAVTEQVIERHLIEPLRDSPLSPVALVSLSDDELHALAAEPEQVSAERRDLKATLASLKKGQGVFQRAAAS
ncbi:P-loop containing nucleoside triphosphate hydrolase protein [Macrophomina phaseolina]|uniref:P-loop containing nucleoside triphosphate hydrolase protein n=1 Tax=Macrophomina phaseolina TaxID=35725 RepID=A0ABQ8GKK8_9PEZI|nr:P-loop containing nucleoside triphosphate hydrolase protein [Macrophomina phaseolina]